jgi:hypothetical protein
MNIRNKIISIGILSTVCSLYGAQVRLGSDLIRNSSADDLYQRISAARKKGNTLVGDTDAATQKINLVAEQLNSGDRQQQIALIQALKGSDLNAALTSSAAVSPGFMAELDRLRAENARLSGSSTSGAAGPANLDALLLELQNLRAENEQLRSGGAGGTGTSEDFGAPPPPPPPPGEFGAPPPPPPPPPMGGGAAGGDERNALLGAIAAGTKLKKTGGSAIKVPDPLAADDPKLRDQRAQAASNAVAFDALAQIVIDVLIGNENKERPYTLYVKDKFYELVRANETFINRAAFDKIFADDKAETSFVEFANKQLAFSKDTTLYDNISSPNSSLINEFTAKLKGALFFEPLQLNILQDLYLQRYINTILVNLIVAQRTKLTPTPGDKEAKQPGTTATRISSDAEVERVLNTIIAEAEADGATLTKDYVYELYDRLNYLRAHPALLRYDTLISNTWRKIAGEATDPILKAKYYPLLETMLLSSPQNPDKNLRALTRDSLFNKITGQMAFILEDFNALLKPKSPLFNAIIDDHTKRLTTLLRTAVPVASLITSSIGKAKSLKDLQDLGAALSARASEITNKDQIAVVTNALATLTPESVTTVTNALNAMLAPDLLDETSQATIKTIIDADLTKNALVISAKAAVTAIAAAYAAAKQPVDLEFRRQCLDNKLLEEEALNKIYNANDRIASDLWSIFTQIKGFGANELNKAIKKEVQNQAVSSYGLLVKIMRDVGNVSKSKENPPLAVLINALKALNSATLQKTVFYVDSVKESQELITGGFFKGKLSALIAQLDAYDLGGFIDGVTQYIKAQNPTVDLNTPVKTITADDITKLNKSAEEQARKSGGTAEIKVWKPQTFEYYTQALKETIIPSLLEQIRSDLNELKKGSGDVIIDGLPLEGTAEKPLAKDVRQRNLKVYGVLEKSGQFKDLWTYVNTMTTIDKLMKFDPSVLASFIKAAMKEITAALKDPAFEKNYLASSPKEEQQQAIIASIQAYLNDVASQMNNLLKTVNPEGAPAATTPPSTAPEPEEEEEGPDRPQSSQEVSRDTSSMRETKNKK